MRKKWYQILGGNKYLSFTSQKGHKTKAVLCFCVTSFSLQAHFSTAASYHNIEVQPAVANDHSFRKKINYRSTTCSFILQLKMCFVYCYFKPSLFNLYEFTKLQLYQCRGQLQSSGILNPEASSKHTEYDFQRRKKELVFSRYIFKITNICIFIDFFCDEKGLVEICNILEL